MPADIWRLCDEANIKIAISPLHDKDITPTGDFKKPHYHGIYCAPGKKTFEGGKEIILNLFGKSVNTVFVCDDNGAAARYFFHLDSPKKYPYPIRPCSDKDPEGYREFGGADVSEMIHQLSDLKKYDIEILDLINQYDIRYYDDLCEYVNYVNSEWKSAIENRTIHWTAFLKARNDKLNKYVSPSPIRNIINFARGIK